MTVFAKLPTLAELAFLIVAYVILGWDVVWQAVKNITRGQVFDEHFLMSVSTIGAFAIGEYPEAVAVMLFYQVGEFFQSLAVKRSRKSISDLMDICPDSATVKRNGVLQVVSPESVAVGEIIVVNPVKNPAGWHRCGWRIHAGHQGTDRRICAEKHPQRR